MLPLKTFLAMIACLFLVCVCTESKGQAGVYESDFLGDGDVDGSDLARWIMGLEEIDIGTFARQFGSDSRLMSASFGVSSEGFIYEDNLFRGASQDPYASGRFSLTAGYEGGGLQVGLGGSDSVVAEKISGGWSNIFVVPRPGNVLINLRYRLVHAGDFEPDECSEALVAVDGVLVSPGPYESLQRYCGGGDGGGTQDSGWRIARLSVPLDMGVHTIAVGGFLSRKTFNNEVAEVFYDDVVIAQDNSDAFYVDDFQDGTSNGWVVFNDSGHTSDWRVSQGKYTQLAEQVGDWDLSAHVGSFAFFNGDGALEKSNYSATARMRSLSEISGLRDDVGLMVRYADRNNYIRLSISKMQGFVRIEKKVSGVFTTLAFTGRPPELGSTIEVKVYLEGERLLAYLNNEPLFSVADTDLANIGPLGSGTVALYTQSKAEFDNVMIGPLDAVPKVVISDPMTRSLVGTDEAQPPRSLNASAVALNLPEGGGVRFVLDSGPFCDDYSAPFTTVGCPTASGFADVSIGEHRIEAILVDSTGQPLTDPSGLDYDANEGIAVGGKYLVMMGDSITNGVGDDSDHLLAGTQNDAANGKNLNRGIAPVLSDLIGDYVSGLVVVQNEGLGGTTSQQGWNRLDSTIDRHIRTQMAGSIWLVLFGTNDSAATIHLPDGSDCSEEDFLDSKPACMGTYKYYLREIILDLKAIGGMPLVGKVPYVRGAPQNQLDLIQNYNLAVEQLAIEHDLRAAPPDFYNYFLNSQDSVFFDNLHPNGAGYGAMAKMWACRLIPEVIAGIAPDFCSSY